MKWFKHISRFDKDPAIQQLLQKFGMAGKGQLLTLMELIAQEMSSKNKYDPTLKITVSNLAMALRQKPKVLKTFLEFLQNTFDITIIDSQNIPETFPEHSRNVSGTFPERFNNLPFHKDNVLKIVYTKMREYKDEYADKSGQNRESVGTVNTDTKGNTKTNSFNTNIRQADEKSSSHQTSKKVKSPKIIYNRETKQFDNLTEEKIKLWEEVYFTVNVRDQLKRMIVWLEAHPGRRAGNEGFIVRWLNKQVDITDSKPIYNAGEENGNNRANNFKLETEPKGFFVAIPEDFDEST